jgi:hypothetical protein
LQLRNTGTAHSARTDPLDLDSGPLAIASDNPGEFIVTNDTCANAAVPGHGTCTMDIRFGPSAAGPRAATLSVAPAMAAARRAEAAACARTSPRANPAATAPVNASASCETPYRGGTHFT